MTTKKRLTWRIGFAVITLIAGILLNLNEIGKEFLGFASVGNWLIYISFVMLAVITLQHISKKKRVVDERMEFVASRAMRITYLTLIIGAFAIMIIDGIKTITTPYSYFMSYLICGTMLIYFVAYKILLRFY